MYLFVKLFSFNIFFNKNVTVFINSIGCLKLFKWHFAPAIPYFQKCSAPLNRLFKPFLIVSVTLLSER